VSFLSELIVLLDDRPKIEKDRGLRSSAALSARPRRDSAHMIAIEI
jgi:hypothetical protein